MHLIVSPPDVLSAHTITEQIEQRIEEEFGPSRVTIHVEPPSYIEPEISYAPSEHHRHTPPQNRAH